MKITKKSQNELLRAANKCINIFIDGQVVVNDKGIEFSSSIIDTMGNIADSSSLQTLRQDCERIIGAGLGPMWIGIKNSKLIFWAVFHKHI